MNHYLIRSLLGLALLASLLMYTLGGFQLRLLEHLEAISYDARLRLTAPGGVNPDIVIVNIDEKSLAAEGRWPWPRNKLAQLVQQLNGHYHAAVIGFDIVFAEPDNSSGIGVLRALAHGPLRDDAQYRSQFAALAPSLEYDDLFATQLKAAPSVLGYYFTTTKETSKANISGKLPPPSFAAGRFAGRHIRFVSANGYGANLAKFQDSAQAAGYFSFIPEFDGILRRVPMLIEYHGAYYASLALQVADVYLGKLPITPGFPTTDSSGADGYTAMEWLQLGQHAIPVDRHVSALVPYRGSAGSFRYVSALDVLRQHTPTDALFGKIVLVGTTAPGLLDLRSTPVGTEYPGVEVQANLVAGILDGSIKQEPAYVTGAAIALLSVVGLLLIFGLPALSPLWTLLATLVAALVAVGINLAAWQYGNLGLPLAPLLLLIVVLFVLDMSYGFFVETRSRRQISGRFGQYVPPDLVREMVKHPDRFTMQGESRDMTVMFSDVCDFTRASEGLDPTQLSAMMNAYLTAMTHIIHTHHGTIDKYMGDAIMAFWGAPLNDPQHPRQALLAALEMQQAIAALEPVFVSRGWPVLRAGIGLNSGSMNVGNMGSAFRVAYTVMGDAVNIASRLEGLTRQYGVDIIVGEDTRKQLPDWVFREMDRVRVKGRDGPLAIYEPVGLRTAITPQQYDDITRFELMLQHYRRQDWPLAAQVLEGLLQQHPHQKLYSLYRERIDFFVQHPPDTQWDGVFTFQTK